MELLKAKKFDFVSKALAPDTFGVVNFEGTEGLSTCYRFEIMLVSTKPDVDLGAVLQQPAVFTILRNDGDVPFHGILAEFEQHQAFDEYVFYRAVLVPKFWWLGLTFHNQVFLDLTIPEILSAVLKDGGLTSDDFDLRLQKDYPVWEYVCQYQESHYNFVSRWMEREGIYYFFEQTPKGEKVVLTDTTLAHTPMPEGKTMYYSPPSGLDETHREEVIHSLVCRQRMLPRKVVVKDYNYRTPSLELQAEAPVHAMGRGEVFMYGEHFRNIEEGQALAKVRAEDLLCRQQVFPGESAIPFLRPGYTFDLEDHYRAEYNQKYLTTDLHHQGSQTAYLISGIQKALSRVEETPYYRNSFTVIPQSVQFRTERKTPPSKFYGTINAVIDAAGSGKYAELDDQGRYKAVLPFDLSGRKDGKASAYLRMAQPYAGTDHGMHFPLHKGTEVLLTFIDGNPDRPIIAAAVPNPLTPSPLNSGNQTGAHITTSGQNKIHFEDMDGTQRILMSSPTANSWVRIGAYNDPIQINGSNPLLLKVGETYTDPGAKHGATPLTGVGTVNTRAPGTYTVTYTFTPASGNPVTATRSVIVQRRDAIQDYDPTDNGIRIRSSGKFWREANNSFGDYVVSLPKDGSGPAGIQYLNDKMFKYDGDFKPTGMKPYATDATFDALPSPDADGLNDAEKANRNKAKWQYLVDRGRVKLAKGDTFNTQEGNIYDFGGYWNYNLGNNYVESHIKQNAVLNVNHPQDILNGGGPGWDGWRSVSMTGASIAKELTTGDWDNGKIWVEKKLGNSYSYTEGYSIEIAKGNSQVISIAGKEDNIEESYTGAGQRTSRTVSGKGVKQEWKYSRDTGATLSYGASKQYGNTINTFNFDWTNKAAASFSFAASASFAFKAAVSFSLGVSLSASVDIDLNMANATKIKVPFLCLFNIAVERGGDTRINIPGVDLLMKGPSPEFIVKAKPATMEMDAGTNLKTALTEIATHQLAKIFSGLITMHL